MCVCVRVCVRAHCWMVSDQCVCVRVCVHCWTVSDHCACCEAENLHAALPLLAWVSAGRLGEAEGHESPCNTMHEGRQSVFFGEDVLREREDRAQLWVSWRPPTSSRSWHRARRGPGARWEREAAGWWPRSSQASLCHARAHAPGRAGRVLQGPGGECVQV